MQISAKCYYWEPINIIRKVTKGRRMIKGFKYGFTTCTLAYLLIAISFLVLFATLFRGSQEPIVDIESTLSAFTLMLSEFSWWGDFYYLDILVPWLA